MRDALRAREYGLIDDVIGPVEAELPVSADSSNAPEQDSADTLDAPDIAASERSNDHSSN